jgi:hypothetical protein
VAGVEAERIVRSGGNKIKWTPGKLRGIRAGRSAHVAGCVGEFQE